MELVDSLAVLGMIAVLAAGAFLIYAGWEG